MKKAKEIVAMMACVFAGMMFAGIFGCAQNTESPASQRAAQSTPTTTDQDAATMGSQVYPSFTLNCYNGPQTPLAGDPDGPPFREGETTTQPAGITSLASADGSGLAQADGKFVQVIWFSHPITTGGTAPSLTGSATGSAAQTSTANPATAPVQHIDPRISASVPIAVAQPGGMIDQQATAATEGSTASPTKTSENELRWQKVEATADRLEALMPWLEEFFNARGSGEIPGAGASSPASGSEGADGSGG